MNIVSVIASLSPLAQVTLVLGCLLLIFLCACNRKAGSNLIAFLHDLRMLFEHKRLPKSRVYKKKRKQRVTVPPHRRKKEKCVEHSIYGE